MQQPAFVHIAAGARAAWHEAVRQHGTASVGARGHVLLHQFRFVRIYDRLRRLPRKLRRQLQRRWKTSLVGIALALALGSTPAWAATINVTGGCTLIDAIDAANMDMAVGGCPTGSGADTLELDMGSTHTLTVVNNSTYGDTGLPVIQSEIVRRRTSASLRLTAVGI